MSAQSADMSPYDMLRSILGQTKSDDEIEAALAQNGYDLSATIVSFMESQAGDNQPGGVSLEEPKNVLIGKSVDRPTTPLGQSKSGVICKFYMSTGSCLRADCRFSHDLSNHLCKYVFVRVPPCCKLTFLLQILGHGELLGRKDMYFLA
jgi:hypothetical protein